MWVISIPNLILSGNIQTLPDYYSLMMYRVLLRTYKLDRVRYLLPNEFGHFYLDPLFISVTVLKRNKVLGIQKKNIASTSQRQQGIRAKEAFAFLISFSSMFSLCLRCILVGRWKIPSPTIFFPSCFQLNQTMTNNIFSSIFFILFIFNRSKYNLS